ncbi:uncharacterized protein LOC135502205 [Lineus longissimus]|uniref:uncharacterized protein LOC135502205 n=1 Tax=Lineus longissimus TaxID=88925 RepID=UPI00315D68F5
MAAVNDIILGIAADVLKPEDAMLLILHDDEREKPRRFGVLLQDLDDETYRRIFRFERQDVERLCLALQIPEMVTCRNGTSVHGLDALHVLLRRLAYPNRLIDISIDHWKTPSEVSYIVHRMLDLIYDQHAHLPGLVGSAKATGVCRRNTRQGCPLENCWGFIDGTARAICRPIRNQRQMNSGHKRQHCYKFQSVSAPNGMIANMYGPVEGRRHDAAMLRMSGLLDQLEALDRQAPGYMLYGDRAYPIRPCLLKPFGGAALNDQEAEFNRRMSRLRVSVEWTFGKIISNFAFLDFKKNQKL